jgi:hypothetical protein
MSRRHFWAKYRLLDARMMICPGLFQPMRQNFYLFGLLPAIDKPNGHGSEQAAE